MNTKYLSICLCLLQLHSSGSFKQNVCIFGCAGSWLLRWPFLSLRCVGFLWWLLVAEHRLQGAGIHVLSVAAAPGVQGAGSVVVARGPRCSTACGVLPDQGSDCLLRWQVDSLPLSRQGSPVSVLQFSLCKGFHLLGWSYS